MKDWDKDMDDGEDTKEGVEGVSDSDEGGDDGW